MGREVNDRSILDKFTEEFCRVVDKHVRYMIVSGFAAISSGRVRGTEDVDMIIDKMSKEEFVRLHNDLVEAGFECMQSDNSVELFDFYLRGLSSIRYTWNDKILPEMEIHFVKDSVDEYQMNKRIKMDFSLVDVYFAPVEGNIAFKEEWLKGQKDLEDATHLRGIYSDLIDEEEIEKIKKMIREVRDAR